MSVASTFIEMMHEQSVAFARFSEHRPRPEAPSASAFDQRSITPEAFQPPSPPYMASGYGQHRPMPVQEGNRPSGYEYEADEYSQDALTSRRRRTAPFPAQAQDQFFSHDYEHGSCREHEPDLDLDLLDCPFHDFTVKSLRARELFIAHVPFDMSEEELKGLCSQYGDVNSVSIMYHDMCVSRCYAYVKFDLQSSADEALLRLNYHEVSTISSFDLFSQQLTTTNTNTLLLLFMYLHFTGSWETSLCRLCDEEEDEAVTSTRKVSQPQ